MAPQEERIFTNQDPARPGGRGSAAALAGAIGFLLLIAIFFLYTLRAC